jgi:hypothetical protein
MLRANRLRELSSTMQAKLGCSPPAKTVTAADSPRNRQVRAHLCISISASVKLSYIRYP